VNTTSDQGDYKLQINGNQYTTGTAALAQSTGEILVRGTYNPLADVNRGNITLNGAVSNIVAFTNGTSTTGYLFHTNTDMQLFNANATGNMRFFTNSTEYMRLRPDGELLLNTTTDAGDYKLQVSGNAYVTGTTVLAATSGNVGVGTASPGAGLEIQRAGTTDHLTFSRNTSVGNANIKIGGNVLALAFENNSAAELMRLSIAGELLLNTTTDAGDYKLQVSGNAYVTGTTVLAATTGNVGIGTASPSASYLLDVIGKQRIFNTSGQSLLLSGATTATMYQQFNTSGGNHYIGVASSTGTGLLGGVNAYSLNILTESARDISFGTTNTEKIRIHSDGGLMFKGQSAAPTAIAGTVYYDTDDNKLKVYNGTTWVDLH
jgi:hypothetical protein